MFQAYLKNQGMIIREPVKNCSGQCITRLNNGITATISKWIERKSLDKLELNDEYCYQIGALTADYISTQKDFTVFPQ